MDNHFHLLLESPGGNVSEAMRQLNVSYTGYYNRRHQRVGHLYQGRFKAIVVEADSYLLELSRYIHLNPIRVGRYRSMNVEQQFRVLRRYRWSSLRGYLRTKEKESFMTYHHVLDYVGGENARGRRAYASFVEEGIRKGVNRPWEKLVGGVLLGEEGFVAKIQRQLKPLQDGERPGIRAVTQAVVPKVVMEKVEAMLMNEGLGETGLSRAILMECLHRYGQLSQAEIGRQMGGVGYSRVSQLRRYIREELQTNPKVQIIFAKIERVLTKD
jgi:hypothetical protein